MRTCAHEKLLMSRVSTKKVCEQVCCQVTAERSDAANLTDAVSSGENEALKPTGTITFPSYTLVAMAGFPMLAKATCQGVCGQTLSSCS